MHTGEHQPIEKQCQCDPASGTNSSQQHSEMGTNPTGGMIISSQQHE